VKDIVVNNKKPRSQQQNSSESPSSSLFGEMISDGMSSSFSSNCDELYTENDTVNNGGGGSGDFVMNFGGDLKTLVGNSE
jgi:hypothetical protein